MKILEIIPVLDEGGAERFVTDLSNSLAKKHDVTLLLFYPINLYGSLSKELREVKLHSLEKSAGLSILCFFQLFRFIIKVKPDVVHSHLNSIVYLLFTIVLYRKPLYVHTIHNDAEKEAGGLLNRLVRKLLFRLGLVKPVTISEESKLSFNRFYGFDAPMIYNGRLEYDFSNRFSAVEDEINSLKYNPTSKVLVNVARISEQKNQQSLITSINELNEQGFCVELFIIGPYVDHTIEKNIKKILTPHIHILGVRENPRDYMLAADAFCLSSIYEGMPITLIEAFSVGVLPICTPVGGIKNMIEHMKNGILCSGISKDSIKEGIVQFLNLTDDQVLELKTKSKETYSRFSMPECCSKYEDLMIQNTIKKKK